MKFRPVKTLCAMLALLTGTSALAAPLAVQYGNDIESVGYALLIEPDGTLLTPKDTYGSIYCLSYEKEGDFPRLYSVTRAVVPLEEANHIVEDDYDYYEGQLRMALMDESGQLLTDFDYSALTYYPEFQCVIFANQDGCYGAMDTSGNVILPARYNNLVSNGEGGFLGIRQPENEDIDFDQLYPIEYIDSKGRTFETDTLIPSYQLMDFEDGLCRINANDMVTFLDPEGTVVLQFPSGWCDAFYGNYASSLDSESGLYGLIDRNGNWAIPPTYTYIASGYYSNAGCFIGNRSTECTVIDCQTGETMGVISFEGLTDASASLFNQDYIMVYSDDCYQLYDMQCQLLYESSTNIDLYCYFQQDTPQRIIYYENGYNWPENVLHLIDFDGNVYGPAFQNLSGISWVGNEGRYLFSTFDLTTDADGERIPVWDSNRYGICNQDGEIILDAQYTLLTPIALNRYWARQGTRWGMIDETGHWYFAIEDYEYLMD